MDTAIVLGILTLLTTILGFIYTWFKDARDRKWRLEDAARNNVRMDSQDEVLQANSLSIEDGKQHAVKAYTEANATNMKIAALQQQINDTTKQAK